MAKTKQTDKPGNKTLKIEDFRPAAELGIALPQLVLAIELDQRALGEGDLRAHQFKAGRQWHKIAHSTGGCALHERYLMATVLQCKSSSVIDGILGLAKRWHGSTVLAGGATLESLIAYRRDLSVLLEADCNRSHHKLEEAFYPIDLEFLPKLAADQFDIDKLDELIEWRTGWERSIGCIGRWTLAVLTQNSD